MRLIALQENVIDENDKFYVCVLGNKPIAYYWARVGTCSNPSCQAQVPLLKGFYLANKPNKKIHLKPIINGNKIDFSIEEGKYEEKGWLKRGPAGKTCEAS